MDSVGTPSQVSSSCLLPLPPRRPHFPRLLTEYLVHLAERCLDSSFQVVALVARGCGGLPIQTATFVPRKTSDLREIIAHIRKTHFHVKNIYYVGYSLGAALGIKYIHEEGKNCPLKGAVAISPPWNMAEPTTVYPIWSRLIVRVLQRYLSKHQELLPNCGVSYTQVRQAKNLAELDQLLIRSYGYDSLEEYYHDNSAIHYTSGIHTPTLVISAEDDPICSIYSHPRGAPVATTGGEGEEATAAGAGAGSGGVGSLGVGDHGPGLCFVKTSTGGHCAYPQGVLPVTKSWVDDVILDWIQALQLQESDPRSSTSFLGSGTKQGQGGAKGKSNGKGKR
jgi:predicted alpha/beta-fold hydrolase